MIRAGLWEVMPDRGIKCGLCAHRCVIPVDKRGICGVRENQDGILFSLVYGRTIAEHNDPIEKKPLFHFMPASTTYSIAAVGCNFRCEFCQNHEISQFPARTARITGQETAPETIVRRAVQSGARSISYTYTEPTVFFEYCRDIAVLAKQAGLANVFVTNGFMTPEALVDMGEFLGAANVDLKSHRDDFYRRWCGARLAPVLDTLAKMKAMGIWVEITTLLIPDCNDGEEELSELARFIRSLGAETPWHISRFYPRYKLLDRVPTPPTTIDRAWRIGQEAGLKYVYTGNIPGDAREKTYCFSCRQLLIDRHGFTIRSLNLHRSGCPRCGAPLEGVF